MTIRPIVRALTIPLLGLALALPALGEGEAPAAAATHKTVNINQASVTELARLPRVGAKLADRIVAHRTQHGAFKRAEDLMEVKGVGEKMFVNLKPYLTVSGPTTLAEKVSSSKGGSHPKSGKSSSAAAKSAGR
jgi:competence protein ComEA